MAVNRVRSSFAHDPARAAAPGFRPATPQLVQPPPPPPQSSPMLKAGAGFSESESTSILGTGAATGAVPSGACTEPIRSAALSDRAVAEREPPASTSAEEGCGASPGVRAEDPPPPTSVTLGRAAGAVARLRREYEALPFLLPSESATSRARSGCPAHMPLPSSDRSVPASGVVERPSVETVVGAADCDENLRRSLGDGVPS